MLLLRGPGQGRERSLLSPLVSPREAQGSPSAPHGDGEGVTLFQIQL